MLILSIDTSHNGSVAVTNGFKIISQSDHSGASPISQTILGMIDRCLRASGITLPEIDAIAATRGPGSFTGIRLGLSTVTGLCLSTGKPSLGVDTLHATAALINETDRLICPLTDAGKNQVYGALFKYKDGKPTRKTKDVAEPPTEFLKRITEKTIFTGSGAEKYREVIKNALKDKASIEPGTPDVSLAAATGRLAFLSFREGTQGGDSHILPNYVRQCEAEANHYGKN